MTAADFRRWRAAMGLTQPQAAAALGVTTRTIARWEGAYGAVPLAILYACAWLEERAGKQDAAA